MKKQTQQNWKMKKMAKPNFDAQIQEVLEREFPVKVTYYEDHATFTIDERFPNLSGTIIKHKFAFFENSEIFVNYDLISSPQNIPKQHMGLQTLMLNINIRILQLEEQLIKDMK